MIDFLTTVLSSFWMYLGFTIWLLILTGFFRKVSPRLQVAWSQFKKTFKENWNAKRV